jgi:L-alanine-DL-glutamate epimerase-like enolase superfamily enzyme
VHSFCESAVATAAAAHLAAALDLDCPHPVDCGVPGLAADVADGVAVRGGMLRVPEGPGLALSPDPGRLGAKEPLMLQADR